MEQQGKKRIDWIDMAKGYGILAVFYGHWGVGEFRPWVYSFHMPLFFFLSGYVFRGDESFGTFCKKKVRSLLIPYIFLGIVMVLFRCWWGVRYESFTSIEIKDCVERFIYQERYWTLWFLATLFCLNFLFYAAVHCLRSNVLLAVVSVVFPAAGLLYYKMGGEPFVWDMDAALMAFPFFFVGYWLKEQSWRLKPYRFQTVCRIAASVVCLFLNVFFLKATTKVSGNDLEMFFSEYGFPPFTYLSAFFGIAFVVLVSKVATYEPIRYIGEYSLLYFAWHQTIMMRVCKKLFEIAGRYGYDVERLGERGERLLAIILMLLMLTACNVVMTKTKLRFMLGKPIYNKKKQPEA